MTSFLWLLRQLYKPHRECRTYSRVAVASLALGYVYINTDLPPWPEAAMAAAYAMAYVYGFNGMLSVGMARRRRLRGYHVIGREQLQALPERFWGVHLDGEQVGVIRAWSENKARENGLMMIKRSWNPDATIDQITVSRRT